MARNDFIEPEADEDIDACVSCGRYFGYKGRENWRDPDGNAPTLYQQYCHACLREQGFTYHYPKDD